MNRLDKIKQEFLKQFHNKLAEENIDLSVETAFDILISADPSRNKKNVRWLIESYLNDGYLWEDISSGEHSKVHETLNVFIRNKNKLEPINRSINRYQSIADIWKMVKLYADDKTGHQVKREEYDKAMSESELVVDNDDIRVVVPMTEYAAKFHGRGTRWCTAADNHNMFAYYAEKAPLFIIMNRHDGKKFQIWKHNGNVQFMDEDDKKVSINYIERHWTILEPLIKDINELSLIPKQHRTSELCKIAVEQNGGALEYVPDKLRTPELCALAVKQYGMALQYIPEELRTSELCALAVKNTGWALEYVPEHLKIRSLCEIAIEKNIWVLDFVPDELRTPELYALACETNGMALQYVPYKYKTYELCKIAVKQNGLALEYVPKEYKTYELCRLAVEESGYALQYVPEELRTPELCKDSSSTK